MTGNSKRQLPPVPHPDHLRKQAKARLAAMRAKLPTARLADAQATSPANMALPVGRRFSPKWHSGCKARAASGARFSAAMSPPLSRALPPGWLLEDEADIQTNQRFFLAGAVAQIGFLAAALVGMALLFVTPAQMRLAHAALAWLGGAP